MRLAVLLALALAACTQPASGPCVGVMGTCVILKVSSPSVKTIDQLEVDVLAGSFHSTAPTMAHGPVSLPFETSLELAIPGDLDLGVVAAGISNGTVVGTGFARGTVAENKLAVMHISLVPPDACTAGQLYCGGDSIAGSSDTLYKCDPNGVPQARGVCEGGCLIRPVNPPDECMGVGGACFVTGTYCGGDKVNGDPQSLYRCVAQPPPPGWIFLMECPNGCVIGSPGHDDGCR